MPVPRRPFPPPAAAALLTVAALLAAPAAASDCTVTSIGLVPLTELAGSYLGEPGGLYPGGVNTPPPTHERAALDAAREAIVPRDAAGLPDPAGTVVLLSIGMSNTTQEYSRFIQVARTDPDLSARLVLVDGAQGGEAASDWAVPGAPAWTVVDQRLAAAGVTAEQVQAVWLKQAERSPGQLGAFPAHAQVLRDHVAEIVRIARARFPSLALVHLSSRIYAGYATSTLSPEPYAYESAFSLRWLVERQVAGDPSLNADPAAGPVAAPWLLWGPYLWADGLVPRAGDGLTWACADYQTDGTHPAPPGRQKVADLLLAFYRTDPSARPWFLAPVTLRAARRGADVALAWTGAAAPWRVERTDAGAGVPVVLDPARPSPDHLDPDDGSPETLRLYRVW